MNAKLESDEVGAGGEEKLTVNIKRSHIYKKRGSNFFHPEKTGDCGKVV